MLIAAKAAVGTSITMLSPKHLRPVLQPCTASMPCAAQLAQAFRIRKHMRCTAATADTLTEPSTSAPAVAQTERRKRVLSGVQPTGQLHLGNYMGAIRNWVNLQEQYDTFYCVVDLHAITAPHDPVELRTATRSVAATYMAAGIDPEKVTSRLAAVCACTDFLL
eukprot:GHRQ01028434.1.p1 GENE.GHRQ01028434.1~~GHRQ01028434.1.p1  ORF type:complete len:164 (+),score=28.16 GHRQ01028434.1:543-1034(+)